MAEQTYEQRVLAIHFDFEKHRGPAAAYRATRNEAAEIAAEADAEIKRLHKATGQLSESTKYWKNRASSARHKAKSRQDRIGRLVGVVQSLQWSVRSGNLRLCPYCTADKADGHRPGCAIADAIGVSQPESEVK